MSLKRRQIDFEFGGSIIFYINMFNKTLLIAVIFVALSVAGLSAMPMSDGFSHNLPDGGCVSSVAKILPCPKDGFQASALIGLFLLLAISLFSLIVNSLVLPTFFRTRGRFFEYHSFFYKIKTNRWLALLENSPSAL